ncbi:MAG: xylulokinase [Clostridia bacterium]|nr:xylulokinase [Clostridia bacterium]
MKYTIGIDIGTSGTKTVLFDQTGKKIASSTIEYPMSQPKNGWAEQNPLDWWNAVLGTTADVVKKSGVPAADIVGIGLSGQMHSVVLLDKDNNVLRPSILWCDQRTAEECADIEALVGRKRLIEITANPALTGFTASKIMWVKKHEPEIWEKTAHILLCKDYIRFMMTGEYATEVSDASGMQLLDVPNRCWSDEVLEKLGIDKNLLGKVYESPEITGYITDEIAAKTGLAARTPVVGGAGDNAAAAVGEGVVSDGRAFTTIGTSGVVFAHTDKIQIDPDGKVHTFCCAVPGAWHVMGVTLAAGQSLRWLRDTICTEEIRQAEAEGVDPYMIMDKEAAQSPIGANRLLYMPYIMGERTPHLDPDCRGGFVGLSGMHTRADLTRAVLEGVCYSLKDCLGVLDAMGVNPEDMRICGGGGKSPFWRKMLADVYGILVLRIESDEGPALGVAILAMVGAGLYPSVKDACDTIVSIKDSTANDPENTAKYGEFYAVYKTLYANLKNSFKALAAL